MASDPEAARCRQSVLRSLKNFTQRPLSSLLAQDDEGGVTAPLRTREAALRLFHGAAETVPAYQAFLEDANVDREGVETYDDWETKVPPIDKDNYLKKYPLPRRCIGGQLSPGDVDFVHVSSGSTGEPTFWARSAMSELSIAARFEQVMLDAFGCDSKRTLAVVAFPMGSWVGGVFTTFCLRYLSVKGHPITVVTPGNQPPEILKCVSHLSPMFERTCILGYPPFVKGVIDAGCAQGLPWSDLNLCLVFAGEVFSEEWRQLVASRAGISRPLRDMASLFGTADAGVIGSETPLSASCRSFLSQHRELARSLFDSERLPTLVQYDPSVRLIEVSPQGTLIVSATDGAPPVPPKGGREEEEEKELAREAADEVHALTGEWPSATCVAQTVALHRSSSLLRSCNKGRTTTTGSEMSGPPPLLRYSIGDKGGIMGFDDFLGKLESQGFDAEAAMKDAVVRRQPFCWVFGRAHWAVSLYGANVFVDQVVVGLEQPAVANMVTGKLVLSLHSDDNLDISLNVDVEVVKSIDPSGPQGQQLQQSVAQSVEHHLCQLSSEYKNFVPAERRTPRVVLWPFGDAKYFPLGVKHVWTR